MDESEGREIAPFRHRHDGWTPERRTRFLERLAATGCVTEACRAVRLSTTSAYRAYGRMPEFAMLWNRALSVRRPMLEDAAFERAVRGLTVPLTRLGQVVGERRQFSDGLLRFLIEREDRRDAVAAKAKQARGLELPPPEETDRLLMERLAMLTQHRKARERAEGLAFADRMRREGKAP